MSSSIPFVSGMIPNPGPLSRYTPPVPENIVSPWLLEQIPKDKWVLDPFGALPQLVVEAAKAGYRVLVAANNPISRFLIEMAASPPSESELRGALADLSASYKAGERLEPHIKSLYMSECAKCAAEVEVETFLWEREGLFPSGRIYHCPNCQDSGVRPTNPKDIQRAQTFMKGGLHYARALERVTPLNDPDRAFVEDALAMYPPRTVYALFTLINKLESLPPVRQRPLAALLLSVFDQTNCLWSYPVARTRPRQLITPPRYRESNVWTTLEAALEEWIVNQKSTPPVPLTFWPEQPPPDGGICIYEGRLRDLVEQIKADSKFKSQIGAIVTAIPRPNQAFWSLSALWAGWLWGHQACAPFKRVLRRRRYDWSWHTTGLTIAYNHLATIINNNTPFLGLIGEIEPGFLSATILACKLAGFNLTGLAIRSEENQAQLQWVFSKHSPKNTSQNKTFSPQEVQKAIKNAALDILCQRGEPSNFLYLQAAALLEITKEYDIRQTPEILPADIFEQIQSTFQSLFLQSGNFLRYGGSKSSLETGQWWFHTLPQSAEEHRSISDPLADRVEIEVVRTLQKSSGITLEDVDSLVCRIFPGLLTPERELIQVCLESYGEHLPHNGQLWVLRSEDRPQSRHLDLERMESLLKHIGDHLGFTTITSESTAKPPKLTWQNDDGSFSCTFYILASAIFSKVIYPSIVEPSLPIEPSNQTTHKILVVPGGRTNLILYKLRNNALLNETIRAGWKFIKYRHVRRLAENELLTKANLNEFLVQDPLEKSDPQILAW